MWSVHTHIQRRPKQQPHQPTNQPNNQTTNQTTTTFRPLLGTWLVKLGGSQSLHRAILLNIITRCPTPRLPSHGHRLHMPYQGCEGTPGLGGRSGSGTEASAEIIKFVLVIRWTAAGRRGAGGGWVSAAVAAAGVRRGRGAASMTRWSTFSCSSSSSSLGCDRVLDISVAHKEGTRSANCAENRAWWSTFL